MSHAATSVTRRDRLARFGKCSFKISREEVDISREGHRLENFSSRKIRTGSIRATSACFVLASRKFIGYLILFLPAANFFLFHRYT